MKAPTIDQYIEENAEKLVVQGIPCLQDSCSLLEKRPACADLHRHPRLRSQALILGHIFSSPVSSHPTQAQSELALGALYLLKGYDLIPDHMEPFGFDDDAVLLDRIFVRNQDILKTLAGEGIPVSVIAEALP